MQKNNEDVSIKGGLYVYGCVCVCIDIKYWASFFYKKKKERNAIL